MIDRLLHVIGIGRLALVKDAGSVQLVQVSQGHSGSDAGESLTDEVPLVGLFGFASNAPVPAEVLLVRVGGDRSRTIAIAINHRPSRPRDMQPGDSMLYRSKDGAIGSYIWLKDGVIEIDAKGGDVLVKNAATVTVKASTKVRLETPTLEVTGDIVSRADGTPVSLNGLRDAYHAHKHLGVQTGSGTSGLTDHDA